MAEKTENALGRSHGVKHPLIEGVDIGTYGQVSRAPIKCATVHTAEPTRVATALLGCRRASKYNCVPPDDQVCEWPWLSLATHQGRLHHIQLPSRDIARAFSHQTLDADGSLLFVLAVFEFQLV